MLYIPFGLGPHTTHRFDDELEHLRDRVLRMGGLVEEQLRQAIAALLNADAKVVAKIIDNDSAIHDMESEIGEICISILATRAPVASDLRFVIAVIKVINDLERMGDQSVCIARMALQVAENTAGQLDPHCVDHLASRVRLMLHDALNAFSRLDVDLAMTIIEQDRGIACEYRSLARELINVMIEDAQLIPMALSIQWSTRALERIGNRVSNICEYIYFLVHGRNLRDLDRSNIATDKPSGSDVDEPE